ncbi:fkbp12-interacting protein of 37 kDa [Phtheirospermum japonicum]|uniref:Fkbp12-interacting protein of 37 kDa n=1 Tax=Phtheirospermum japonicum TaxID=374723 RepID=A0A830C5V0_9LAMI|nr:fkbp12-interacting protein of 37 kDa [Phtheirospermum japonicum]
MLSLRFRNGVLLFRMNLSYPKAQLLEPKFVVNYLQTLRSSEESLREQLDKAKKKEAAFIVTFAKREQEIAELKNALRDLRAQLKPPSIQARRLLLDPAIHEEFTRLKNLVEEKDKKVKELQDNIAAVSFTPQSKMGKMLMAKCRTLQEENEEIGNQANEGKVLVCIHIICQFLFLNYCDYYYDNNKIIIIHLFL